MKAWHLGVFHHQLFIDRFCSSVTVALVTSEAAPKCCDFLSQLLALQR